MSALAGSAYTLADWGKLLDPDGKIADITEILSQSNKILENMLWREGNLPTGERTTTRTSLPDVYWRLLNQGVAKSKSTTAQVDFACAMLEARSEVDADLANMNGNLGAFRINESRAFLESMAQELASTLFYGNSSTAPEEFNGFATLYNSTSNNNGQNILLGGGSQSDNSSVWLVGWGMNTCTGIFPKGSKAGVEHRDLGEGDAFDSSNNRFRAYMDQYKWKAGLAVKDWRYAVRIPNIDISNLVAKSSAADLFDLMIKAIHRIPNLSTVKPVFYMNRTCFQMLDIQGRDDVISGGGLRFDMVEGKPLYTFRGIPVQICDALTETESLVS